MNKTILIFLFLIKSIFSIELSNKENIQKFYSTFSNHQNEIKTIFTHTPIIRQLNFKIRVPKKILDELFNNLNYAVKMANKHAHRKYQITKLTNKNVETFKAFDGYQTYATIYPLNTNKNILNKGKTNETSRYIYYIEGYFLTWVRLDGKLILDVKFQHSKGISSFFINSYILIDNSFLRGMTHFLMNFKGFQIKINKIIDSTIYYFKRTAFITARGIYYERSIKKRKRNKKYLKKIK